MSVINTMLQDLDKRNGRSGGEVVAGDAVRSIKKESPWHLGRNTLVLILAVLVVSLAGAWSLQRRSNGLDSSRNSVAAAPVPAIADNAVSAGSQVPAATQVPLSPPTPQTAEVAVAADTAVPVKQHAMVPTAQMAPTPSPPITDTAAPVAAEAAKPVAITAPVKVAAPVATPPTASASSVVPTQVAALTVPPAVPASLAIAPATSDKTEAAAQPSKPAAMNAKPAAGKSYSAQQVAANLLSEAAALEQQGRSEEAKLPLQRALAANPLDVQARQMLIQLQLDTGRIDEATALLVEGRRLSPEQPAFMLGLARLKVDGGDVGTAIQILEAGSGNARDDPQYHAFLAALLLRVQRFDEAAQHYLVALRSDPSNASWLVGAGVAFEGVGKLVDAAEAYRRADGAANLTPEIASFASERLKRLGR